MGVTLTELFCPASPEIGTSLTLELLILLKTAIVEYFSIVVMAAYKSIGPSWTETDFGIAVDCSIGIWQDCD